MDERRGPQEVVRFMMQALAQTYADFERAVNADGGADLLITSDLVGMRDRSSPRSSELRWASQVLVAALVPVGVR